MVQRFTQDGPRIRQRRQSKSDIVSLMRKRATERLGYIKEHVEAQKGRLKSFTAYAEEYYEALSHYNERTDEGKLLFPPNVEGYITERFKADLRCAQFDNGVDIEVYCVALQMLYSEEERNLFDKASRNRAYANWNYPQYSSATSMPELKTGDKAFLVKRDINGIYLTEVTVTDPSYPTCTIIKPGADKSVPHGRRTLFASREAAMDLMTAQTKRWAAKELKKLRER